MAALYKIQDDGEYSYFCGGNIISNKRILTVAHCIHNKFDTRALTPGKILTIIGGYDLNKNVEVGRETVPIIKIDIHQDWNPFTQSYDADLALLELEHVITFNNYIKPICLWESQNDPATSSGIVVGYGKSEDKSKRHENIPKQLQVPIHTQEKCFLSKPDLAKISSTRTICAGAGNGKGVCIGDSGSGLYVKINNAYYLRALVSSSLKSSNSPCDVNSYSVFTNVWKYKTWIKSPLSTPSKTVQVATTKKPTVRTTKKPIATTRAAILRTTARQTGFDECGIMSTASGLIQNGKLSTRTEFPWLASIVANFHSSGPLVTRKHVISILSVVADYERGIWKPPASLDKVKIYLGGVKYNDVSSPGAFMMKPQKVTFHPNYLQLDELPVANFAVITLNALVPFSEIVRPVCLWTYTEDAKILKNSPTYGVGYGTNEKGETSDVRKYAKLTLVDETQCKNEYESKYSNFMKVTATFCLKGSSSGNPCHGDESIYIKYGNRWYFRGFSAQRKSDDNICHLSPILYEDVARHAKWIQSQIKV